MNRRLVSTRLGRAGPCHEFSVGRESDPLAGWSDKRFLSVHSPSAASRPEARPGSLVFGSVKFGRDRGFRPRSERVRSSDVIRRVRRLSRVDHGLRKSHEAGLPRQTSPSSSRVRLVWHRHAAEVRGAGLGMAETAQIVHGLSAEAPRAPVAVRGNPRNLLRRARVQRELEGPRLHEIRHAQR